MNWPSRYPLLDACRGVAASMVVFHHVAGLHIGHEAVMLFFVISGYCITASAFAHAKKDAPLSSFLKRRARRILPPYLAAVAFFVVTRAVKLALGGGNDLVMPITRWLQNLTLTQWISLLSQPKGLSADNPTNFVAAFWSLQYEEQFYLFVAFLIALPRLRWVLAGLLALASLGWTVQPRSLCYGLFLEYWYHFAIGGLLFIRLTKWPPGMATRAYDLVCLLVASACLWLDWRSGFSVFAYRELWVVTGFAGLLAVARPVGDRMMSSALGRLVSRMGTVSYSLYLIHQFNLVLVARVVGLIIPPELTPLSVFAQYGVHLCMATGFWWLFERPFLSHPGRPPAPSQQTESA